MDESKRMTVKLIANKIYIIMICLAFRLPHPRQRFSGAGKKGLCTRPLPLREQGSRRGLVLCVQSAVAVIDVGC